MKKRTDYKVSGGNVFKDLDVSSADEALTKAALAAKKAKGERVGGVPYGFSDVDGVLVPNEDERRVIIEAKYLSSTGLSLRGICAKFAVEGVVFRNFSWNSPAHADRLLKAEV